MGVLLDNLYYKQIWHDCHVDYYEGYRNNMVDFHAHDYFEISLILSGCVKVFLSDLVQEGTECRLVLSKPKTPHFISVRHDSLYSRLNLIFSEEFVADYVPEWAQLLSVFGQNGRVITLTPEQSGFFKEKLLAIKEEKDHFRRRLLILETLSHIKDTLAKDMTDATEVPLYVTEAMAYISKHYSEKLLAADLAWHLGVSRTTLMTAFKKYTGNTIGDYTLLCRLKHARKHLRSGIPEEETARLCGFGDTCGLIRAFKKAYGMTPRRFLQAEQSSS